MKTLLIVTLALLLCLPLTPAAGAPTPSPGVEILATGCSSCMSGDRATFVLNVINPGPARGVQVVALLRHPNGAVYPMRHHGDVVLIPAGPSSITLADFIVPGGEPGVFLVEAAVVDPESGVTLGRHVLGVARQ